LPMTRRTENALDALDRKILAALQQDATRPLEDLARVVGSSKTPVWNRIKRMRDTGVIRRQVAILDPEAVGAGVCFHMLIRTSEHEAGWLDRFMEAIQDQPEITAAHRLAGDIDYILTVRVPDVQSFDAFYRRLISKVRIFNVTSLLSMEEIKSTTELPIRLSEEE